MDLCNNEMPKSASVDFLKNAWCRVLTPEESSLFSVMYQWEGLYRQFLFFVESRKLPIWCLTENISPFAEVTESLLHYYNCCLLSLPFIAVCNLPNEPFKTCLFRCYTWKYIPYIIYIKKRKSCHSLDTYSLRINKIKKVARCE